MILAIDCREFVSGRVTGIGRFLQGALEEIAESRPHLTTVALADRDTSIPVSAPHIRLCRLPRRPALYWDQILLPQALRRVRATAFFSPYYKAPLFAPCPTVITIHDLIPISFPDYRRGPRRAYMAAFRLWAILLSRRAGLVITDSAHSKADIVATLGLPPHRVQIIPIGVAPEFQPDPPASMVAAVRGRYGIDGPYLLAVGNFLPHKNLLRLVEAYRALPGAAAGRIRLVLAGRASGHGLARPIPPEALVCPGVLLTGFVSPEDLPVLYGGATALVCPSLAEGFGLPVLEAMACGTPVVCSQAGALPEVAGEAALYVDPLNVADLTAALQRILEDQSLRHELTARGIARARLFDPHKTTSRLVDLLEHIAAGQGA
jgi:glycosyltransferase involved in cell wall biosynthesis